MNSIAIYSREFAFIRGLNINFIFVHALSPRRPDSRDFLGVLAVQAIIIAIVITCPSAPA
jgi:hypothetical protein